MSGLCWTDYQRQNQFLVEAKRLRQPERAGDRLSVLSSMLPTQSAACLLRCTPDRVYVLAQIKTVSEDAGTVEALKQVLESTTADSIIVLCGDTVTDINLQVGAGRAQALTLQRQVLKAKLHRFQVCMCTCKL